MPAPPADDFYALLGVHEGANGEELRRAWRQLASRWHPDRAGEGATPTFQQLAAAYEVLADPIARAAYDRRRRRPTATTPHGTRQPAARSAAAPSRPAPQPARQPVPAAFLARLCTSLSTLIACGAASVDDEVGFITLVLRADEAARGGMITISMPVELWCPACAPQGAATPAARSGCARCGGTRMVDERYSAWLAVHPGVTTGEVLTPSADLPGMVEPVRFRVRVAATK